LSRTDSKYLTDDKVSFYSNIYRCTRECVKPPSAGCDGKPNAYRLSVSLTRITSLADVLPMHCGVRCLEVCYSQQCLAVFIFFATCYAAALRSVKIVHVVVTVIYICLVEILMCICIVQRVKSHVTLR
jgi:hypothetical protein